MNRPLWRARRAVAVVGVFVRGAALACSLGASWRRQDARALLTSVMPSIGRAVAGCGRVR
ncbi:hypothetical protein ACWGKS_08100 [Nocardiopsis sp. NPDC055879]